MRWSSTQGWPQPVSTDRYLLWVVLDPEMSGTGLTTEYSSEEFADGYPVIFINTQYSAEARFYPSLIAHEFAHSLQFALREYSSAGSEPWYWEASAQWQAELAAPAVNGHTYTAAWYADWPGHRFDSMQDEHQYGMFVFNDWLETQLTGPDGLRQVWLLASERSGDTWDDILAESTGEDVSTMWSGFTAAFGNNLLTESAEYADVSLRGDLEGIQEGAVAYLGTDYYRATQHGLVRADSPDDHPIVTSRHQYAEGEDVEIWAGDIIGITGLWEDGDATYRVFIEPIEDDTGDQGDDSGDTDDGGGGTVWVDDQGDKQAACATTAPLSSAVVVLLSILGVARRRGSHRWGSSGAPCSY
jgi:hypothetical protein